MSPAAPRALAALVAAVACAALGDEPPPELFVLRSALKGTFLTARAREVSTLQPEQVTAASLWRLRLEPRVEPAAWLTILAAYEQRARLASSEVALSSAGLPPLELRGPFRLTALEGALAQGPAYSWWQEVDRLAVVLHLGQAELTVGRQAVGWGRGLSFGAVDLFAPFTPLEVDREWRRGVDAARLDLQLGQRASLEALAVFSDAADGNAYMGRARAFLGPADAELIGGWRARDVVLGAVVSAALFDAEVHGELAAFVLPEPWPSGGTLGNDRVVLRAVTGASYQVNVGSGLRLAAEYHYSGFGLRFPVSVADLAADGPFMTRLQRGDAQILSQHAIAVLAGYEPGLTLTTSLQVLVDPADGSGVVAPAANWDVSDTVSLTATGYVGWGRLPAGLVLRSQFGATPLTVLLQLRLYDQRSVTRPEARVDDP